MFTTLSILALPALFGWIVGRFASAVVRVTPEIWGGVL